MKKVAAYMRVGNKEQLELTEQQQKEGKCLDRFPGQNPLNRLFRTRRRAETYQ